MADANLASDGGDPAAPTPPSVTAPDALSPDWDAYLAANPDVGQEAQRVTADGEFPNQDAYAQWHYENYGQSEGRNEPMVGSDQPTSSTSPLANDGSSAAVTAGPDTNAVGSGGGAYYDPSNYDPNTGAGTIGPSGGGASPGTGSSQLTLTPVSNANPGKGFNTDYYAVTTNQGTLGAAIPATLTDSQRVRLVDSQGNVLAEGSGNAGAQQIATLANYVSGTLGDKAQYSVEFEQTPNQFANAGGDWVDRANPGHSLINSIIRIAGPIVGAALTGGLGVPAFLGAAAGGGLATAATGGNLEQSLLAALGAGAGNSLGGAFGDALTGAPVSFAGTDALGSLLKGLGLNGLTGGGGDLISGQAGANDIGSLLDSTDTLTGGGAAGLASGAAGAVPGLVVNGVTGALPGLVSGAAGAAGSGLGNLAGTPTTVDNTTVTGQPNTGAGVTGDITGGVGTDVLGGTDTSGSDNLGSKGGGFLSQNNLLDLTGQTAGGVAGNVGVYGLASLFGLGGPGGGGGGTATAGSGGGGDAGGVTDDGGTTTTTTGGDAAGGGAPGGDGGGAVVAGGGPINGTGTAISLANTAQPTGLPAAAPQSALAQALNASAAPDDSGAPVGSTPGDNARVSNAPDIYPWAGHQFLGSP